MANSIFTTSRSDDAQRLSPAERIAEIAEILAAGLIRLRAQQSSELLRRNGESSLDFTAHQSGHANAFSTGKLPA